MNLPWKPDDGTEALAEIRKEAQPRDPPRPGDPPGRWARFTRGIGNFYTIYIRGWTWNQVERLREAKFAELETGNDERRANAIEKIAAARKLDAETMLLFQESERRQIEAVRQHDASATPSSSVDGEPTFAQWDELRKAIEIIELKGGNVSFPAFGDETVHGVDQKLLPPVDS